MDTEAALPQQQLQGVTFDPRRNKWKARIHFAGQERYIGRYKTNTEAAMAYDQAARLINAVVVSCPDAASEGSLKKRSRILNFPDMYPSDPEVASRMQAIMAQAVPAAAAAAAAAVAAAAEEACALGAAGCNTAALQHTAAAAADATAANGPAAPRHSNSSAACVTSSAADAGKMSEDAEGDAPAAAAAASFEEGGGASVPIPDNSKKRVRLRLRTAPRKRQATEVKKQPAATPDEEPLSAAAADVLDPFASAAASAAAAAAAAVSASTVPQDEGSRQLVNQSGALAASSDSAAADAAGDAADAGGSDAALPPPPAQRGLQADMQTQQQQQQQHCQSAELLKLLPSLPSALPSARVAAAAAAANGCDIMDSHEWDSLMALIGVGDPLPADPLHGLPSLPMSVGAHHATMHDAAATAAAAARALREAAAFPEQQRLEQCGSAEMQGSSDSTKRNEPGASASPAECALFNIELPQQQKQQLLQEAQAGSDGCPVFDPNSALFGTTVLCELEVPRPAGLRGGSNTSSNTSFSPAASAFTAHAAEAPYPSSMMYGNCNSATDTNSNVADLARYHSGSSTRTEQLLPPRIPRSLQPGQLQQPLARPHLSFDRWGGQGQQGPVAHNEQQQPRLSLQPPQLLPLTACCGSSSNLQAAGMPKPPFSGFGGVSGLEPATAAAAAAAAAGPSGAWRTRSMEPAPWSEDALAAAAAAAGRAAACANFWGPPGAAGAPDVGMPAGQQGLFACLATVAQVLAAIGCCLHALTDLELHMLQQPRQGDAVGAMMAWLQAAWHREAVASQAVPLTAGPSSVAAAAVAAKAAKPSGTEPGHLSLLVVDQLLLLVRDALSYNQVDLAAQRGLLLDVLALLQQGLGAAQEAVATAGAKPAMCREFLQVWGANRRALCSNPAAFDVLFRLVQLL